MGTKSYKDIVQHMFYELLEQGNIADEVVNSYISPNYTQQVNGNCLDYTAFKAHLHKQRELFASVRISFKKLVQESDTVFSNHLVEIDKKDGVSLRFQVMAQFTFVDGKITACDELSHLIVGKTADADLGWRH